MIVDERDPRWRLAAGEPEDDAGSVRPGSVRCDGEDARCDGRRDRDRAITRLVAGLFHAARARGRGARQ